MLKISFRDSCVPLIGYLGETMSSSDQSDNDIYQSDGEMSSFLQPLHSSSDEETFDIKDEHKTYRHDRRRVYRLCLKDVEQSLSTKQGCLSSAQSTVSVKFEDAANSSNVFDEIGSRGMYQIDKIGRKAKIRRKADTFCSQSCQPRLIEFDNDLPPLLTFDMKLRLMELMKQNHAVAYLSPSFMVVWFISFEAPPNVICDVCVFSDTKPVRLLTFHKGQEADVVLRYNATITRHLVSKVRKKSSYDFTALGGVLHEADCNTEERFMSKMQKLEFEARKTFVPNWLYMDAPRCLQIVELFLKIGQKYEIKWFDVSESLNEQEETVTSTRKGKCLLDTNTKGNGFSGHQVGVFAKNFKDEDRREPSNSRREIVTIPKVVSIILQEKMFNKPKEAQSRKESKSKLGKKTPKTLLTRRNHSSDSFGYDKLSKSVEPEYNLESPAKRRRKTSTHKTQHKEELEIATKLCQMRPITDV